MMERELLLRLDEHDVADEVIAKCDTFRDALRLAKQVSGLSDKVFSQELDIDPAQWSRIWSSQANFPDDKLISFLKLCNNLIPVRWLATSFNLGLHILKSELERENEQLRMQLAQQSTEMEAVKKFMREIGGAK